MRTDLTGRRFGRLTAIKPVNVEGKPRRYWLCRCDCGKERIVGEYHLRSGHTKSCGCLRRDILRERRQDLTGKRFGRLLVLEPVLEENGSIDFWKCRCDCGAIVTCHKENLTSGSTQSCGCLRTETRKKNMKQFIHFVDGTCVERIASKKPFSNNTSGCRGVYRRENNQWRACIGFQGKIYNLGTFRNYDEAVIARKQAEEEMYGSFLRNYQKEYGWEQEHET